MNYSIIDTDCCPNCGSENISWSSTTVYAGEAAFEFECEECGASGEKIYSLVFSEWEYNTPNMI